jgi:hypothetical protein
VILGALVVVLLLIAQHFLSRVWSLFNIFLENPKHCSFSVVHKGRKIVGTEFPKKPQWWWLNIRDRHEQE